MLASQGGRGIISLGGRVTVTGGDMDAVDTDAPYIFLIECVNL